MRTSPALVGWPDPGIPYPLVIQLGAAAAGCKALLDSVTYHANIDLPVDVRPLFRGPKLNHQLIEGRGV